MNCRYFRKVSSAFSGEAVLLLRLAVDARARTSSTSPRRDEALHVRRHDRGRGTRYRTPLRSLLSLSSERAGGGRGWWEQPARGGAPAQRPRMAAKERPPPLPLPPRVSSPQRAEKRRREGESTRTRGPRAHSLARATGQATGRGREARGKERAQGADADAVPPGTSTVVVPRRSLPVVSFNHQRPKFEHMDDLPPSTCLGFLAKIKCSILF